MGHYKNIRGWIQLDAVLYQAGEEDKDPTFEAFLHRVRSWIATQDAKGDGLQESFCIHAGHDSSVFLFVGTRVKDYGKEYETFIRDFVKEFPHCYGLVSFDEFEHEKEPREKVWVIRRGGVISETRTDYKFLA